MSAAPRILVLDPFPEVLGSVYMHWTELGHRVEITTSLARALSMVVRGRYTVVFLPVRSPAFELPMLFDGVVFARTVLSMNQNYRGRFFFYVPLESGLERELENVPDGADYILVGPDRPEEELREDADRGLRATVERAMEIRRAARKK